MNATTHRYTHTYITTTMQGNKQASKHRNNRRKVVKARPTQHPSASTRDVKDPSGQFIVNFRSRLQRLRLQFCIAQFRWQLCITQFCAIPSGNRLCTLDPQIASFRLHKDHSMKLPSFRYFHHQSPLNFETLAVLRFPRSSCLHVSRGIRLARFTSVSDSQFESCDFGH